tara:strand:- start:177 stop:425 length:249 start_codon:yes stop_codon:yes gene_type:complete
MEGTRGVYCVDVTLNARPISMRSNLPKINKTISNIPMALDDNLMPLNKRFIKRFIKDKDINKYHIDYSISNKKYLSGLCYDI